jgi:hypothetical protein
MTHFETRLLYGNGKIVAKQEITKSRGQTRCHRPVRRIDARMPFVVCSKLAGAIPTFFERVAGGNKMTRISTRALVMAAALAALTTSAFAQAAAPTPWVLAPDMGYGYDKDGKTFSYKMGTNNAGLLLKGAKKVPKGTLFFIGQNGQLYMRSGPFLEGDGKFMFGPG